MRANAEMRDSPLVYPTEHARYIFTTPDRSGDIAVDDATNARQMQKRLKEARIAILVQCSCLLAIAGMTAFLNYRQAWIAEGFMDITVATATSCSNGLDEHRRRQEALTSRVDGLASGGTDGAPGGAR
jgi:hypothetical protein